LDDSAIIEAVNDECFVDVVPEHPSVFIDKLMSTETTLNYAVQ
jgi:hypothetical protein